MKSEDGSCPIDLVKRKIVRADLTRFLERRDAETRSSPIERSDTQERTRRFFAALKITTATLDGVFGSRSLVRFKKIKMIMKSEDGSCPIDLVKRKIVRANLTRFLERRDAETQSSPIDVVIRKRDRGDFSLR